MVGDTIVEEVARCLLAHRCKASRCCWSTTVHPLPLALPFQQWDHSAALLLQQKQHICVSLFTISTHIYTHYIYIHWLCLNVPMQRGRTRVCFAKLIGIYGYAFTYIQLSAFTYRRDNCQVNVMHEIRSTVGRYKANIDKYIILIISTKWQILNSTYRFLLKACPLPNTKKLLRPAWNTLNMTII